MGAKQRAAGGRKTLNGNLGGPGAAHMDTLETPNTEETTVGSWRELMHRENGAGGAADGSRFAPDRRVF